jgi:UDP-N-acetylglucosamine 2-epimerase (non-hydrolysing)
MKKYKILLVGGARPNFMKIAPIWRELVNHQDIFEPYIVHTGQHYDYEMSKVFFDQFQLPNPHYYLNVGSGSHAYQTAQIMINFEKVLSELKPDLVVVVGDVNSTIAASLTAVKLDIAVAHVEAGLRSFDKSMPEEINRILTDRISDLLLVSEPSGIENLLREGTDETKIHLVGNTMIDSLVYHLENIRELQIRKNFNLEAQKYCTITLHRPSNVDNRHNLEKIANILTEASKHTKLIFPAHPRTTKNIEEFGLRKLFDSIKNLQIIQPIGYFEFMSLVIDSRFVITDSGGIQEETTWLGIPCITLRDNTERPITVTQGTNVITGLDFQNVRDALIRANSFDRKDYTPPALWDGRASQRILKVFIDFFQI